ncbi:hypothetical protein [Hyphomicrobium sp. CS1GBMeth3]|uniref:hypothetical protein n=1 Tax=Hyphomicrobium sp. CS1GBMeth3 TaxID=1892845 RepID=UPI0009300D45|nr:hypothetical protein [Hyphomicrobium sp. CS1GBMeth3]
MTIQATIDDALSDPLLLGAALGDISSWSTWRIILKAAYGLPLNDQELEVFSVLAGGRDPPERRVAELWIVAGRRSGKTRVAAAVATFVAAFEDHASKLAPGEPGYVLTLSPSISQARAVRNYAEGFFRSSRILAPMLGKTTADELHLPGDIVIATHANSFRTVRGRTLLAAIFDESAFWRDESSALPDVETYRAVLPALGTTGGMLIGISSPYRRVGLLHQKHRDHFDQNDPDVLVIQGGTQMFNPTIAESVISRARESDPEAARAEWDAEFRSDISALLDDRSIDAAVDYTRPLELPPRGEFTYAAFTDASAGRHDHFTLCIGHREGDRFIADVIQGAQPPFDPNEVASRYAKLAREYRCNKIIGDNYAGEWTVKAFQSAGISYTRSDKPKSQLYLEALPWFMRGAISIPNHQRLIRELRLLERRVAPSGKDRVDHGQSGSDDYANALVGALAAELKPRGGTRVGSIGIDGSGGRVKIRDEDEPKTRIRWVRVDELGNVLRESWS